MNIILETDRLRLREFTEEDAALIHQLNSDPDVTQFTCDPIFDLDQAKKNLQEVIVPHYAKNYYGRWAAHLRSDMEFIGWCGLKYRPERDEVDLGYRFMKKFWGKGYATEAARATLNYGFVCLGLPKIIARALPQNLASIRVLEKCGMKYVRDEFVDGHLHKTYEAI